MCHALCRWHKINSHKHSNLHLRLFHLLFSNDLITKCTIYLVFNVIRFNKTYFILFIIIWDRHNLSEGRSPIILRGRREKAMYFFFQVLFKSFFFNYLAGVISLWLMAVPFILPTPLFRANQSLLLLLTPQMKNKL